MAKSWLVFFSMCAWYQCQIQKLLTANTRCCCSCSCPAVVTNMSTLFRKEKFCRQFLVDPQRVVSYWQTARAIPLCSTLKKKTLFGQLIRQLFFEIGVAHFYLQGCVCYVWVWHAQLYTVSWRNWTPFTAACRVSNQKCKIKSRMSSIVTGSCCSRELRRNVLLCSNKKIVYVAIAEAYITTKAVYYTSPSDKKYGSTLPTNHKSTVADTDRRP